MKKSGFTLVELLGVITLLAILSIVIFPSVLEMVEKNQAKIDQGKLELIYSAADTYMSKNRDHYPNNVGNVYCISVKTLANENLLPFEVDDELLYADSDKTIENVVRIAIGDKSKNAYSMPKDGTCTPNMNG